VIHSMSPAPSLPRGPLSPPAKKKAAPARKPAAKKKSASTRKPAAKKKSASTRKPAAKKKPAAKRRPAKRKPSAKRKPGARKPSSRGGDRWLLKTGIILAIGLLLGVGIVVLALYREAQVTVAARLEGAVWDTPGRVYGGPIELWPGLSLTPAQLASDLRAAGYAQVTQANAPGDFQLAGDAIKIKTASSAGPGWDVPAGEHLVTFRDGRISSASPSSNPRLAPPVIATLAGPSTERRSLVPLDDIPPRLQQAVLAMEDSDFYDHPGLSFTGVLRALFVNLTAGQTVQGGSTLTQQLAKNLFLDPQRSLARKAREAFLALAIEQQLDKDAILELYLNGIYLGQAGGQGVHGVAEAARVYFGKPVDRLTLGECATISGIISAPNAYSPLSHPEKAIERRDVALGRMAALGMIDQPTLERERELGLELHPTNLARGASWGVDYAVELVEKQRGPVASQGLHVYTTLSPALQRIAQSAVTAGLAEVEAAHPGAVGVEAAAVVLDARSGQVLALVGGRDYASSAFNRAVHAQRQVGSVVKPLTLVKALDADPSLRLNHRLPDEPLERRVDGKTWRPANYDGVYRGSVSLRQAIVHSYNVPSIHMAELVGMASLQRFWRGLGLGGATQLPSAALGAFEASPLQVAGAYTLFAAGGVHHPPFMLLGISDPAGQRWAPSPDPSRREVSEQAAGLAVRTLQAVVKHGTGERAADYGVSGATAGKTGTTDDGRDAWFVGVTPRLVVAVWVGFDRGRSHGLSGASAALPIWARIVAASGTSGGSFRGTSGLVQVELCTESHEPAGSTCPEHYSEWFAKGNAPDGSCSLHGEPGLLDRILGDESAPADGGDGAEPASRDGVLRRLRDRMKGEGG
jgi:penicillin-binding protein 1B